MEILPFFSVYVDATDACNTLAFQLGSVGVGTSIPSRSWNLKVSIQSVLAKSYFSWKPHRNELNRWFVWFPSNIFTLYRLDLNQVFLMLDAFNYSVFCRGCGSSVGKAFWIKVPQTTEPTDISSIPSCSIGVREKILATPSEGVWGKTHVRRNKHANWASRNK